MVHLSHFSHEIEGNSACSSVAAAVVGQMLSTAVSTIAGYDVMTQPKSFHGNMNKVGNSFLTMFWVFKKNLLFFFVLKKNTIGESKRSIRKIFEI